MAHCLRLGLGGSLGHRLQEKPEKPVERAVPLRALPLCCHSPPQGFPKCREKHNQRDRECWWALLSAGEGWGSRQGVQMPGKERLPSSISWGQLGNSLSS